jgi:lysozyme family protein
MVENFKKALPVVLKHEGGWVKNPADSGEETYRGVARAYHPHWDGWTIIDQVKATLGEQPKYDTPAYWRFVKQLNPLLAALPMLQEMVTTFYRRNFWLPIYDRITTPLIAAKVFDMAVNMGHEPAHKLVQRAAGVEADGAFGSITLAAVNSKDPIALVQEIKAVTEAHYREIIRRKPEKRQFLATWVNRAQWPKDPHMAF